MVLYQQNSAPLTWRLIFAIPPNSAFHGLLEEFIFSISKIQNINTLAINSLGKFQHFTTVTILHSLSEAMRVFCTISQRARIGLAEAEIALSLRMSFAGLPQSKSFLEVSACRLILSCIGSAILVFGFTCSGEEWRKESGFVLRVKRWFSWLILEPTNPSFQIC